MKHFIYMLLELIVTLLYVVLIAPILGLRELLHIVKYNKFDTFFNTIAKKSLLIFSAIIAYLLRKEGRKHQAYNVEHYLERVGIAQKDFEKTYG